MRLRRAATAALLITAVAFGACGGGGTSVPKNIRAVGRVSGSDAFVAVTKYGSGIDAYVCDGKTVGETFQGRASGGSLDLRSDDGARLQARVAGKKVTGRFSPTSGTSLAFTAQAAEKPAGLYRAEVVANGQTITAGWVLLPDGEQRGTQRMGVVVAPAPILDGTSNIVRIAGMTVTAMAVDESNP